MRLGEFQDGFARALLAQEPRMNGLAAQPAFAVYRNTVMKACVDALQGNYPAVARLVGEEWFRAAATLFVRVHPPRVPMLVVYGEELAHFLAGFEPAADLPYLPGVARADRFWTEAHVARDEMTVAASEVARLNLEALARTVLKPHASARWAWFEDQPIATLWMRNRYPGDASEAELDWHGEGLLLVRPHAAVEHCVLDAAGCAFLDACAAAETVAAAASAALAVDPAADLSALMQKLLEAGAFGGIQTRESGENPQ